MIEALPRCCQLIPLSKRVFSANNGFSAEAGSSEVPKVSPQCWSKNLFSWVSMTSELPRIGRRGVVICKGTHRNRTLQIVSGAFRVPLVAKITDLKF